MERQSHKPNADDTCRSIESLVLDRVLRLLLACDKIDELDAQSCVHWRSFPVAGGAQGIDVFDQYFPSLRPEGS